MLVTASQATDDTVDQLKTQMVQVQGQLAALLKALQSAPKATPPLTGLSPEPRSVLCFFHIWKWRLVGRDLDCVLFCLRGRWDSCLRVAPRFPNIALLGGPL